MEADRTALSSDGLANPCELHQQKLEDLLSRVAFGDKAAFAELYDEVAELAYGLAHAITGDASSAQEVTADVLAQVWRRAPRYRPAPGGVQSWVLALTRRRAQSRGSSPRRPAGLVSGDPRTLPQDKLVPVRCVSRVAQAGHQALVTAPAELDLDTAELLRVAVLAACAAGHATVVIDMTGSRFCDCAGLSALIWATKLVRAHGGDLQLLVPADGMVPRLLALTGLNQTLRRPVSRESASGQPPLANSA